MCNKIYNEVMRLVAEETEIPVDLILSKTRLADVVEARQMVAYFCFRAGISPRTIADKLGISRQAVCQKIATIADRRASRSFDFVFQRVARKLQEIGI